MRWQRAQTVLHTVALVCADTYTHSAKQNETEKRSSIHTRARNRIAEQKCKHRKSNSARAHSQLEQTMTLNTKVGTIKSFIKSLKHDNTVKKYTLTHTYMHKFYRCWWKCELPLRLPDSHRQIGETNIMTIRYLHIGKALICFCCSCCSARVDK